MHAMCQDHLSGVFGSRTGHASLTKPENVRHLARMRSASLAIRSRSAWAVLLALSALISAIEGNRTEDRFKTVEFIVTQL